MDLTEATEELVGELLARPSGTSKSPPRVRLRSTFFSSTGAVAIPNRCSACGLRIMEARSFSVMTLAGGADVFGAEGGLEGLHPAKNKARNKASSPQDGRQIRAN